MLSLSWQASSFLLLGGVLAAMMVGLPVALAFLAVNLLGAYFFLGGEVGIAQSIRGNVVGIATFSLVPIPLFVFMGEMLFHSGLAIKAIVAVDRLIRGIPGRLPIVVIVSGTIFSAISGSTIATTAMLGSLMLPEMLKRGYDARLSMGAIMGIGAVDALIPPSGLAVLLGSLALIPINDLLIGGVVPGLIMAAGFIVYIVIVSILKPTPIVGDDTKDTGARWWPFVRDVMPLIAIFTAVVLSMTAGWATPTEAAAVGAIGTIVTAVFYRCFKWSAFVSALEGTAIISASLLFIVMGATIFSQLLAFSGATSGMVSAVLSSVDNKYVILAGMILILLFLGAFIDEASMMLMTLPFFMPLVKTLGFDLTWYGIIYMLCMQIGLLSPPFGLLLFAMRSVAPAEIKTSDIFRAVTPYMIATLLMMLAVIFWPPIATWLPSLGR